ncbi:uncharacterized protein LOC132044673 [Lycium ferocissimum]|uniref:uncharacterized protein LOC132044673 n=1 Tax=Lycium ferocissimum TaxID=112874 RepID=UPI00281638C7|nr:uncharacterized protein LOC132044673 [Lycium ferocissimum]
MSWRKLVCNNGGLPRWIFILRLAALGRLQTRDRLFKWGITTDQICPVCDKEPESLNHLFFVCEVSAEIWQKLLNWIGIRKVPTHWTEELGWAELNAKGRNPQAEVYRMMLAAAVYYVWRERNARVFQSQRQSPQAIIKLIIQDIHARATKQARIALWLEDHNFYPS